MTQHKSVRDAGGSAELQPNPVPLPLQGRSRDKLDRLLTAGAQLFAERGFEGTRISDVAQLGGCSVGVFYQRFADKDAFFAAVRSRWIEQTRTRIEQSLEDVSDSSTASQVVRLIVKDALSLFRDHLGLIRAFLNYESDHPESATPMLELAHFIAERQAEWLLQHEVVEGHPEPVLAARFGLEVLRGTLVYLALRSAEMPLGLNDERLQTELERMLGAYLGVVK